MRRLLLPVVIAAIVWLAFGRIEPPPAINSSEPTRASNSLGGNQLVSDAFSQQRSDIQVQIDGRVSRILSDDNDGDRHQRFIVELTSGQTVLIAHNIDLSDRVAELQINDRIEVHGEYEWNPQGGVIHWTHRDPQDRHVAGWIRHGGRIYQ